MANADQFFFGLERQARITRRQRQVRNLFNGSRLGRSLRFFLVVAGVRCVLIAGLGGLADFIG